MSAQCSKCKMQLPEIDDWLIGIHDRVGTYRYYTCDKCGNQVAAWVEDVTPEEIEKYMKELDEE